MQNRNLKDYLILSAKGMAMGAADVVPGVSGGTIAFITGVYEELIQSINSINKTSISLLFKGKLKDFWSAVNGNFLISLFLGIGISVASLAKIIKHLLINEPVLIWSFFFGLIISSIWLVGKEISSWNLKSISGVIVGTAVAYWITTIQTTTQADNLGYFFLCGMIAICAMILPGISGSFILVLLGAYYAVLDSISNVISLIKKSPVDALISDSAIIIYVVGLGAVIGLLSFSKLLYWLFNNYKNRTIAILTGFLIGSLNKVWPWKKVVETLTDEKGEHSQVIDTNVLPGNFDGDPQILFSILLAILGFALVFGLEKFAGKKTSNV